MKYDQKFLDEADDFVDALRGIIYERLSSPCDAAMEVLAQEDEKIFLGAMVELELAARDDEDHIDG